MAKIKSEDRVLEYSSEYKFQVVELTNRLPVDAALIAEVLGLHPVMVYRWRQEQREGRLMNRPSRRVSMSKESDKEQRSNQRELKELRKKVKVLEKENDFLKKWDRYLKERNQNGSSS